AVRARASTPKQVERRARSFSLLSWASTLSARGWMAPTKTAGSTSRKAARTVGARCAGSAGGAEQDGGDGRRGRGERDVEHEAIRIARIEEADVVSHSDHLEPVLRFEGLVGRDVAAERIGAAEEP